MLTNYFPVLVFLVIAAALGGVLLGMGWFLGPRRPSRAKSSPYECGFEAFSDARAPFNVRFYLVAILFIIFDLETAFLFPWALVLRHVGWMGLIAMFVFLGVLLVGFVYEWKRGALDWE